MTLVIMRAYSTELSRNPTMGYITIIIASLIVQVNLLEVSFKFGVFGRDDVWSRGFVRSAGNISIVLCSVRNLTRCEPVADKGTCECAGLPRLKLKDEDSHILT